MDFQCSFGSTPICLDTEEAKKWLGSNIPLKDVRITTPERVWPGPGLVGITFPFRQPQRPDLRLGSWFYPTGASRWSEFHALVGEDQYQAMVAAALGPGGPAQQTFIMQQGTTVVSTPMYLLPPRPLAKYADNPGLYLISLVDERYLWQNRHGGDLSDLDDTWTWTELLTVLASQLGITLTIPTPIESVYGQPHPNSDLASRYENAALLLDAVCWNVGRTLVRNLDGTYSALRYSESNNTVSKNKLSYQLAGGDFTEVVLDNGEANRTAAILLPQSVTITFPLRLTTGSYVNTAMRIPYTPTAGDVVVQTINLSETSYSEYIGSPGTKTLHDTAEGWVFAASDAEPQNLTDLQALALQLAEDFYQAQVEGLDIVYPAIAAWTPEGIHDVTWSWASDNCSTRVQRKPYNFGVEEMLHHWPARAGSSASGSTGSTSSSSSGNQEVVTSVVCTPEGGLQTTSKNLVSGSGISITNDTDNIYIAATATGGGTAGVTSLNGLTGALNVTANGGVDVVASGTNVQVTAGVLGSLYVSTDQSTTSTSFVDLTTPDSLTVTLPAAGAILVIYNAVTYCSSAGNATTSGIFVDGSNTGAQVDNSNVVTGAYVQQTLIYRVTGLTAGSHTVDVRHLTGGATGHWLERTTLVLLSP